MIKDLCLPYYYDIILNCPSLDLGFGHGEWGRFPLARTLTSTCAHRGGVRNFDVGVKL
jgi:hypothetical protein